MTREIAEAAAHVDIAAHRLLVLVRQLDLSGAWADQGAKSCAHWLSWRIGMNRSVAREHVRIAHALANLPRTDEALRTGQLSYSQARAITRVAKPDLEETLLEIARTSPAWLLERIVHAFESALAEAEGPQGVARLARQRSYIRRIQLPDGMTRLEIVLPTVDAARLIQMLDGLRLELIEKRSRRRRGDGEEEAQASAAVERLIEAAREGGAPAADAGAPEAGEPDGAASTAGGGAATGVKPAGSAAAPAPAPAPAPALDPAGDVRHGPNRIDALIYLSRHAPRSLTTTLPLSADAFLFADRESIAGSGFASFGDGTNVSAETARRLLCTAAIVPVQTDGSGNVLNLERRSRLPSEKQVQALVLRDRCCRFPGCDDQAFLDAHHIHHWSRGGPTNLDNLLLLCRRHHTLVHEGGFRVENEGGVLRFYAPGGQRLAHEPLDRPGDADESFRRWLEANRFATAARPPPDWDGTEEIALAVDCLIWAAGLGESGGFRGNGASGTRDDETAEWN